MSKKCEKHGVEMKPKQTKDNATNSVLTTWHCQYCDAEKSMEKGTRECREIDGRE